MCERALSQIRAEMATGAQRPREAEAPSLDDQGALSPKLLPRLVATLRRERAATAQLLLELRLLGRDVALLCGDPGDEDREKTSDHDDRATRQHQSEAADESDDDDPTTTAVSHALTTQPHFATLSAGPISLHKSLSGSQFALAPARASVPRAKRGGPDAAVRPRTAPQRLREATAVAQVSRSSTSRLSPLTPTPEKREARAALARLELARANGPPRTTLSAVLQPALPTGSTQSCRADEDEALENEDEDCVAPLMDADAVQSVEESVAGLVEQHARRVPSLRRALRRRVLYGERWRGQRDLFARVDDTALRSVEQFIPQPESLSLF